LRTFGNESEGDCSNSALPDVENGSAKTIITQKQIAAIGMAFGVLDGVPSVFIPNQGFFRLVVPVEESD
jgi:hypothetical protein